MKLPRNGSPTANGLLLAVGLLAGCAASQCLPWPTWLAQGRNHSASARPASAPARPAPRPALLPSPHPAPNPSSVLATAAHQPVSEGVETLRQFYGQWATTDPAAAAAHAQRHLKPGAALGESLTAIAQHWGADNARTAWQWTEKSIVGPLKTQLQTAILQGWSQQDPAAASQWLTRSGLTSQPFFDAVAATWAARDPAAAADWAKHLPDPRARSTAEVSAAREIAASDPAAAAALFSPLISPPASLPSPDATPPPLAAPNAESLNLASAIADLWATTDPHAAAAWIASLPAGPGREEAAATLATVWAASDIHAATAWSAQLADPATRRSVIEHLGTTWGAIEPDQALAWLGSLPPADAAAGTQGALHSWAATDPVGLQAWLDEGGPSPLTDIGRLALGDTLTETNLPRALDLALGIAAPTDRDSAVSRFYHAWRKTDPDSAAAWRDAHWPELPQSTRQSLTAEARRTITAHP